jgi:hypothetical protein
MLQLDQKLQIILEPFLSNGCVQYIKWCFGYVGIGRGWTLTFAGTRICYIRSFGRIGVYRNRPPILCVHIGATKGHVVRVWFNEEQEVEMWVAIAEIEELRMLRNIVLRSV